MKSTQATLSQTKTALVLSGGSMLGAFQAGAIAHLLDQGFKPDVVMGISAGALNGTFLVHEAGRMNGHTDWPDIGAKLKDFWVSRVRHPRDLIRRRFLLLQLWRILTHRFNGWYDYRPLVKIIQDEFKLTHLRKSPVDLVVGAVDWTGGEIEYPDKGHPLLIDYIIASASIPVILPYWRIKDRPYVDGGMRDVAPLRQLVDKGIEEVVVILTQPERFPKPKYAPGNLFPFIERIIELMLSEILENDLAQLEKINQQINSLPSGKSEAEGVLAGKRYIKCTVIRPERAYEVGLGDFSPKDVQQLISDGHQAVDKARIN
ncbi:MAG: patatin-like phospholipase family protein [Bacteroidota bacterium]